MEEPKLFMILLYFSAIKCAIIHPCVESRFASPRGRCSAARATSLAISFSCCPNSTSWFSLQLQPSKLLPEPSS